MNEKRKEKPSDFTQDRGLQFAFASRTGTEGPGGSFVEARRRAPENDVVVRHSAGSGCVARPVAKCRAAPLLFSVVNLRAQGRQAPQYRQGACRGS